MLEDHPLPPELRSLTGQRCCPFGDGALRCADALLAAETCEELFTPQVRTLGCVRVQPAAVTPVPSVMARCAALR